MMGDIRGMGSMLILTGGDPMKRPDLFDLIAYGRERQLPISITPSTTPTLTRNVVARFKNLGVAAMGISVDGPTAEAHDAFRGVEGTFDQSMRALDWAREYHIPVQVNTTVTVETRPRLGELYELLRAKAPPVKRWSLFLLVPVGRGVELGMPGPSEVEALFEWVYEIGRTAPFHVSTVEAPHYRRYWIQRRLAEGTPMDDVLHLAKRMGLGVRDGNGVVFVSHRGEVYPAGFLPAPVLGNVRQRPLSEIYRDTPSLVDLRNMELLRGKCGRCDFKWACGGSRARAYAVTGDPLESDPFCAYQPAQMPA